MDKFPHRDRGMGGHNLALFGKVNYKVPYRMAQSIF